MPRRPGSVAIDPEQRRHLAVELFNHAWTLIEKEGRSERETELMIHAAHASRFFWEEAGGPLNHARGEWQVSRVYATAGLAEPALRHARRCLELCRTHGIGDFDLAYAYEALARAHALAGDADAAAAYGGQAREAAAGIADADDRELLLRDLATIG